MSCNVCNGHPNCPVCTPPDFKNCSEYSTVEDCLECEDNEICDYSKLPF